MQQLLATGVVAPGLGAFWTAVAFPSFGLPISDTSGTSLAGPEPTVMAIPTTQQLGQTCGLQLRGTEASDLLEYFF